MKAGVSETKERVLTASCSMRSDRHYNIVCPAGMLQSSNFPLTSIEHLTFVNDEKSEYSRETKTSYVKQRENRPLSVFTPLEVNRVHPWAIMNGG